MSRVYSAKEKAAYAKKMQSSRSRKAAPRKRVAVKRVATQRRFNRLNIQDQTQKYILQLLNPYEGMGVGIPSAFPLKSQKVYAFMKGTFELGTSGIGYVTANPCNSNSSTPIRWTQATSVGNDSTALNAFTNVLQGAFSKLPYTNANLTQDDIQCRLVSCGLRIRYIGRSDGLNGLIRSIETPDHTDISDSTPIEVSNFDMQTTSRPSEHEWTCVNYSGAISNANLQFNNDEFPLAPLGEPPFAHVVTGVTGDSYAWEYHQCSEYIGVPTVGKTVNISDPNGYAKVCETVKGISSEKCLAPKLTHMAITKFARSVGESLPEIEGKEPLGIMNMEAGSALRQALKIYPACI